MKTPTDAQLNAEADRRSQPVVPEATLSDAIWWLTHDALVPEEHISGLVIQGQVYDFTHHVEYGVCTRPAGHDGQHGHGIIRHDRSAAELMARRVQRHADGCGRLVSRIVADTGWGAA